jgi:iduronate 2-sulfatase
VPVLRDPATQVKDHVYHAFPRPRPGKGEWLGRAIRTERYRFVEWKSIRTPAEPADLELYDYLNDPAETVNVAAQQPEVVARLCALLARHPAAKLPVRPKP